MTVQALLTDSIAAGTRVTLVTNDTLFVKAGTTTVRSNYVDYYGDAVVLATGNNNTYDIQGTLLGDANGIIAGNDAAQDGLQEITVASTGVVKSYSAVGIQVNARNSSVTNHGHIEGRDAGLLINSKGAGLGTIDNTGEIVGVTGGITRSWDSTETLKVHNSGLISGGNYAFDGAQAVEIIVNDGTMSGTISLGGGDDEYDGRLGVATHEIQGDDGNDTLLGGAGDEMFDGGADNDVIEGGGGADLLNGGAGADQMKGGTGNDTYVVDDAGDVVIENAGEGVDYVFSTISYALTANVEQLTLVGSADINGTGNALGNVLVGNSGKNTLKGGAGNDLIDGGMGIDRLEGGTGDDTYGVDETDDVVVESSGAGTDTVKASVSYTLSANVEKLILTGTGNLNGTGSADANTLIGNAGNNILKGMAGNDTLDGGAGADRLEGGLGNDTFIVDNAGDVVVESSGAGTDTVKASVSYALSANAEKLILTGIGNLNGTGSTDANTLIGNSGNNILKGMAGNDVVTGGAGADRLYGGAGKDTFVFNSAADSKVAAQDKIFDFSHAEGDRIDLHTMDASSVASGDQTFVFIGANAFHKVAGELRFEKSGTDTFIYGDTNGDGTADFSIVLDPVMTLGAGDFVL